MVSRDRLRPHWRLGALLVAFAGCAFVVPTLAPVAINDDFLYTRSVEILVRHHRLEVLPAAAMTLVVQVLWGGAFAAVFGDSIGVLRVATLAMAAIGAVALYGLCRELEVSTRRSALGAAVYLFNPLSFAMSYSFMTDSYLTALVTVALYGYVRGLRGGVEARRWVVAGSVAAGLAFLVRQPGFLVVVGVVTYLAAAGYLRRGAGAARLLVRVAAVPTAAVVAYYVWFRLLSGDADDSQQTATVGVIGDAGVAGLSRLAQRLAVLSTSYAGFFVLPLVLAALAGVPRLLHRSGRRPWAVAGGALVVLALLAIGDFSPFTGRQPWAPQFVSDRGFGPPGDLRGGRPGLAPHAAVTVVVTLSLAAALVALLVLVARRGTLRNPGPGVLVAVGGWMAIGVLPQSVPVLDTAFSYDRYFLPLLPIVVALVLWGLRGVRLVAPVAWVVVLAMGGASVAATHDHLALQRATWAVADRARAGGIAAVDIDGGAAWDGYHLYELSREHPGKVDLRKIHDLHLTGPLILSDDDVAPWWVGYYASADTSRYVVANDRLYGYRVVARLRYSSWLHRRPQTMYLLTLAHPS